MQRFFYLFTASCFFNLVAAQFPFFGNMFNQQQQQQQQQQASPQWASYADSTPCSLYLCPSTLSCVPKPVDCPCPNVQDIKCIVPDEEETDGTVVCVRGRNDCSQVDTLARKLA